jgi:uncharacterized LabA/DUF88 family protein
MRLVLIDGSNLYESARSLGITIDYKRLFDLMAEDGQLLRIFHFTALRDKEVYSSVRKQVDWMKHNGYTCVTKETKEFTDASGHTKIKGNVDVEIAVHAWMYAEKVSEIYLFSGDGDFTCMVREIQNRFALKFFVVSAMGLVATELRSQADKFINLQDMRDDIERIG